MPKDDETIADFLVTITEQVGELSRIVTKFADHAAQFPEESPELRSRNRNQDEADQYGDDDAFMYH